MPLVFEDEDEYSEGLDIVEEVMASEAATISAELSMSRVTLSEPTRTLAIQRATARSPSPMDIDSDIEEIQVRERINRGATVTATRASPSGMPSIAPIAIPSKRPTDVYDAPGPTSLPPSPSTLPQPAKRLHATPSGCRGPASEPVEFGAALDPFIIAHDASVQALLDANHVAWGTAYEIARGISHGTWKWSQVTKEKIEKLAGNNIHNAPHVTAVIQESSMARVPAASGEIWIEYDREQDAIMENRGRGLGGMGPWKGRDGWYGGRIQQVGRLELEHGKFSIKLEKPEIRRSHRFSRFLGSRRILQIRVPDTYLRRNGDEVRSLLSSSKFILCGRVYLPFHAKEGSMYLVETNQDFDRASNIQDGDQLRMSLKDFIDWHNPFRGNLEQPISKWSTRWALGLSTSMPTIEFDPQHIYNIPDITASPQDWVGKAPAEKVLTDGCGLINGAALTQIMRVMQYSSRPTAVQGRIGGSKGMWVLHPDPDEEVADGPAKIWIRPSQTKIKLVDPRMLGRAQRIFDLLAPSRVSGPSNLSAQTLINLSYNGIDHQVLKDLMALGLKEEIQPFTDWNQPHSMVMLWKSVEKAGKVVMARLRREFAGQARALGIGQLRPWDDPSSSQEDEDKESDPDIQQFIDSGHKTYSGQPYTLHETVLELLQAGFHPLKLEILFQKVESVMRLVLDDYVEKFHIPVMESCEAYIVPDPYGVLEEGQIHFRSSTPIINQSTGEQTDMILGDVLVSRNPTRLPSDIQKVKAVAHPKLSNYFNVIVFPVKGKESLASFLGGGDYDGDTVMINWCQPLVTQFRGSAHCKAPKDLSTFFEREVEHVKKFDCRASKLEHKQAQQALQKVLLLGLAETKVGLYSMYHDAAVYEHGYGTQEAIHLAYMFTTCLDASKTGLRVMPTVFDKDAQQWGSKKPWYACRLEQSKSMREGKEGKAEAIVINGNDTRNLSMKRQESPFILDVLVEEGDNLRSEVLANYRKLKTQPGREDGDLCGLWLKAKAKAREAKMAGICGLSENLDDINAHVEKVLDQYKRAVSRSQAAGQAKTPGEKKEDLFTPVAREFASPPRFRGFVYYSDDDIQMLKASLASTKSITFAFSVAFRDLCTLKARGTGNVPITSQFAQYFAIPGIVARTYAQVYGDT